MLNLLSSKQNINKSQETQLADCPAKLFFPKKMDRDSPKPENPENMINSNQEITDYKKSHSNLHAVSPTANQGRNFIASMSRLGNLDSTIPEFTPKKNSSKRRVTQNIMIGGLETQEFLAKIKNLEDQNLTLKNELENSNIPK